METILIFIFAGLAIIFLVLWILSHDNSERYAKLANEMHGLGETMNRIACKMPSPQESKEKEQDTIDPDRLIESKPVTLESVRLALRFNGISPKIQDTRDPDALKFSYNDRNYRLNVGNLPYMSLLLVFKLESDDDVELMKEVAQYVSLRSYGACVFIIPEDGCFLISADIYADTYLYIRNNLRYFLEVVENTGRYFYSRYDHLREEKKKASHDAANTALLAPPTDAAGNKILS